jgi:hypothetical protein
MSISDTLAGAAGDAELLPVGLHPSVVPVDILGVENG